ncbi:MAG: DUF885 family protein, partial [Chitinophagaceae bacterium]
MIKTHWLLFLFLFSATIGFGQTKTSPIHSEIENALKEIKEFLKNETERDSADNHPLGSNEEEDFLRRYTFYKEVNAKLDKIDKVKLGDEDQVNLELLQYSIEDKLSSYRFKAYLNPILADEGFHTGLAHMGSEILSSKKEFDNYIKRVKDIPRYVDEHIALMRKGLELGICQPRSILN